MPPILSDLLDPCRRAGPLAVTLEVLRFVACLAATLFFVAFLACLAIIVGGR